MPSSYILLSKVADFIGVPLSECNTKGSTDAALLTASNTLTLVAWGQTLERIVGDTSLQLPDALTCFIDQYANGCSPLNHLSLAARRRTLEDLRAERRVTRHGPDRQGRTSIDGQSR